MKAKSRTKEELIQELEVLRRRVASMEESKGKGEPEEEAQRDREERYRFLFEESRDAMFITSVDGKVVEVNQATLDIFGYMPEEAMRLPVLDAYAYPEDRVRFRQELQKKGSARDYEVALLKKNGAKMDCLVSATVWRAKDGSILGYQGAIRDITKQKRMEETLRASEAKFRGLFENVPDGVFHSTPDGKIILANPALVQMLGYDSEEELRALDLARDLYVNPEDREMVNRKLVDEGRVRNFELKLKRKDGQQVIVLENARAVCDEADRVLYIEGTATDISERKQAEEALRASEAKFRGLFENLLEGVYQSSPDGRYLTANAAFVRMMGYQSEDELLAVDARETWASLKDRDRWIQQLEERGELRNIELVLKRKDGQHVTVLENDRVVRDKQGKFLYREGLVTDITERKRAEEALADMASFAEMNPAPVLKLDRHGTILLVNPAAGELLGQPDLLGKSWYALCPELESSALKRVLQGDDMWHEAQISERCLLFTYRASLERSQVYVFGADLTERKRAEDALRESETMLRQSEKMAVLGTLTAGVAHELNNPAAAAISGAGQLETAIAQFEQAQSQLRRLELTAAQQRELQRLTHEVLEQAARPPELNALARSDREGELETWLEEQGMPDAWTLAPTLVNLNYDAAGLTVLAESFAPDQLPVIINSLDATYAVHSLLTEIGQSTGRISEIVKALKSYSYLDQAPVQAVDVHEGLDNTLLVLGHKLKSGISVRQEYAPDLPNIQANGSELNQVWTNIIDNAADALGKQGEITIRTRQEGDWVVIEIEDDGPGIPADIQPRIFEPFFTTKPPGQGTGLGLDISYNIVVHKHRGNIKVVSEPGKTCFQVWLPVTSEAG
ncbi:MAG: PAS domain S-box protein [Dehalococcoidia bacterium]